jgi:hypothetical protein
MSESNVRPAYKTVSVGVRWQHWLVHSDVAGQGWKDGETHKSITVRRKAA